MSPVLQAFEDLLAANAESLGFQQQLTINGTPYDAIINVLNTDDKAIAGMVAEKGGFKAMVRIGVPVPNQYAVLSFVDAQGATITLEVLSVNENSGYTEIEAGQAAGQ